MADTSKITLGQLKTALTQAKNYTDNEIANVTGISKIEPENLDMPKVFFYGNALPTTKDNVNLTMDYVSNTAIFSSFIKLKCQGTSSMSYAKKNFTVSMFSDESRVTKLKKDFKGWGAQSKFCLKANYVDTTHTRNLSGARIAYDMVNSRPDSPFKQQLLQCPRNGAVDGFPIKLYFNGEFYGIYTWNIPKDGWMFNMDANNSNHMVLCAEKNNDSTNVSDDILRCEFRKEWDGTDGNSWSIEFGTYSDTLKNSFNRCVNFVMTATDEEFKTNIGDYFDLYSLLDYYCFSYLVAHIDGLAKNMLMVTYDGVIWGASLYDMDSIYGANWQGTQFKATNIQCPEQYQDTNSLLWQRIESCFSTELYARYLELRQGALTLSNIIKHVEEIHDVIPDRVFADEKAKWTSLPGVSINTMTRFRNYMRDRAAYVDAEMKAIGTTIPCTGITLNKNTLTFDSSSGGSVDETISTTYTQGYIARNKWAIDNGAVFGEVKSSTSDITTDYIPCDSNTVFVTTEPVGNDRANHGVMAYDSNKQGLYALSYSNQVCTWYSKDEIVSNSISDGVTGITDSTITINNIPSNVAYIRCSFATSSADNVTIVRKSNNTQTLTATVQPSNTTDAVTWSVSPTGIVTVDGGVVTPIANGECTITATCGSYSDTCTVTVSLPSVECTGISLDQNTLALGVFEGGTTDDSNKNYLENATWKSGTLSTTGGSSTYSLADSTTDYRCQLTDLPVGTYTLHNDTYTYKKLGLNDNGIALVGTAAMGYNNTDDITFNITNPNTTVDISVFPNGVTPITGVTLTRTDISGMQEYSFEYTATGSPSWGNQVNPDYLVAEFVVGSATDIDRTKLVNICIGNDIYHISNTIDTNPSIINALSNKCNTSVYAGNVYVDVAVPKSKYGSTLDEFKTYCSNNGISNIYINKNIQSGGTSSINSAQLTATVTPENCTQPVVWSVSPEGIVTVDNGLVTAVANGQATVTATCGTQTATCNVTVSGIEEQPIPNGLLVKLDSSSLTSSSTTWEDLSGNGVNFTLSDGTPNVSDQGLLMTSVKVKGTKPITLNGAFTEYYCVCVKHTDTSAFCSYNINNETKYCTNASGGVLKLNGYSGDVMTTANILKETELQRIAVVRPSEGDTQLYIDGVLQGTYNRGTFECNGNYDLVLGASSYNNFPNAGGNFTLKELQIFNRALSAEEAIKLTEFA